MIINYKGFILESNPMEQYKHLFELKIEKEGETKEGKPKRYIDTLGHGMSLHSALDRIVKMQVAKDKEGETISLKDYMKFIRQEYDYLKRTLNI